ncbi:hypothetical protein HYH03_010991 [Edaphochlamys debaryana]|uniref:Uncharacterized protein n=1 Tax=Edaphochlamys debaryana TaxID=47281 RepID=A0A835XX28_9CHLO|nr:hypothetical protein HYH03_010991 [Edaphochlamys debaryana]|eukprot:KAG2490598.1 hypothetical protein HYH03_010991 [Edaphochlamys debaryana]
MSLKKEESAGKKLGSLKKNDTLGSRFGSLFGREEKYEEEEVEQEEKKEEQSVPPVPFLKLFSTADKWDILLMVLGTIGAIGNGTLLPLFAIFFGDFTDAFGSDTTSPDFVDKVSKISLKFTYLSIAALFASYLECALWMYTGNRQANRLRSRFLKAVLHQDVAFFDVQSTTGGLVQGLNEDSIDVQNAISEKLGGFLHHSSTFVTGFIIGFVMGWEMALVMVGCMPFMAAIGGILAKGTTKASEASAKAYAEASAIAQQSISQIRTVAAYNREQAAMEQYDKALEGTHIMAIRQSYLAGASFGAVQFVMYGTYAVGLFFGAYRVAAGAYTGGTVLQVLVATLMGGFSLGQAAPNLQYFAKGRMAGARMFAVIDRKPAISDEDPPQRGTAAAAKHGKAAVAKHAKHDEHEVAPKAAALHDPEVADPNTSGSSNANGHGMALITVSEPEGPVMGEVELRDVDFAYPSRPEVPIFTAFSLHVPAGKTVALVGSSGSGKSTVVQLIERFYDPSGGQVLLDGRDLRSLPLRWLRRHVGLVSQEPTLFATTIYQNIAIGAPGSSAEEVEAAARAANAHTFISNLPQGYETQVGERGVQMSGGQKQRIAIARAILKSPKVMLLDEATSALDTRSEAIVQAALDRLVVGRTTVVVAHRLSTIKGADKIAVVQSGRVVEQGTHEELLRDPHGAYSILVKLQMEAQQKGPEADPAGLAEGAPEDDEDAAIALAAPGAKAGSGTLTLLPAPTSGSLVDDKVPKHPTSKLSLEGKGPHSGLDGKALQLVPHPQHHAAAPVSAGEAHAVAVHIPNSIPTPSHAAHAAAPNSNGSAHVVGKGEPAGHAEWGMDVPKAAPELDKDGKEKKEEPYKVPFSRLLGYAKGERMSIVVGCIASAAAGAKDPGFAFVLASMTSIFYTSDTSELKSQASFYCWMFFVIAVGSFAMLLLQGVAFGRVARVVAGRVRVELFGSILRQEIAWFDDEAHASGKLTANLATDASYVRGAVADVIGIAFMNLSTLALGYLIGLAYDWRMALLITGVFPFVVLSMLIHLKFHTGFTSDANKLYANANQMVTEAFSSIRVIHAYNLQDFVSGTYARMLASANSSIVRQSNVAGIAFGYSTFTMFAMYALIIYFMGQEIHHGWVNFDDSLKAFMAILLAAMGMAQASMAFPDLGNAKGAVQRIFPIIDRKPAIDSSSPDGAQPDPQTVKGEIEFNSVRFVYPSRPSVVVFNNFSLRVAPGCVTALVGESGSGKSTVVGLIERFYDPLSGQVLLDGLDVRKYNLRFLRAQIGLVSQEPLLFNGTVADNIRIGKQDATEEELVAAAEAANARSFIESLPEKYNTRVGEGGIQLSGGQKQRVAIARAVVKNPKVMLLDEATSALDARAESIVQAALDRIMQGRTSIVIAHRLSTIRHAHAIAVVYRGTVLEQGTHEQLMALPNGSYARLVAAQSREQPAGGDKGKKPTSAVKK